MHWTILSALILSIDCLMARNSRESSSEESRADDILYELHGICLPENDYKNGKELKKDMQTILSSMTVYKDIVKLNEQLKTELQWILRESRGEKQITRIIRLLKLDVKGKCRKKNTQDCSDLQKLKAQSGVYILHLHKSNVKVYCDMTTDGGGWTVIQRRIDGSVNFQKTWAEYENGFGNENGEYWLGNKNIHSLTSSGKYELRINLIDIYNRKKYAVYKIFALGDVASKYKLTIGDYSGNAGDSMTYHNGMMFSTTDQDNDKDDGRVCANKYGPWWHNNCCYSGLNRKFNYQLYWRTTSKNLAKTSVMMIRKQK